jgi:tetratricopeptide (TPR) repeat protein
MKLLWLAGIFALGFALSVPAQGQQSPPPSSSKTASPDQQPSPAQVPDKADQKNESPSTESPGTGSKIKRKLEEAVPSCIGILGGSAKCRQTQDDKQEQKKAADQQALRTHCRDVADQPGTPDPACVELKKQDAAHDLQVGDDYFSDKQYPSAENRYRLVLQEDPANTTAMLHLAQVLEKMHKSAEAAEEYQKFLATNPPDAEAKKARAALEKLGYRPAPLTN